MKSIVFAIILLGIYHISFSQQILPDKNKTYRLKSDADLTETDISGTNAKDHAANTPIPEAGYRFRVVKTAGTNYIIKFLKWRQDDAKNANFVASTTSPGKYFQIPIDGFSEYAEEAKPKYTFTVGTMLLPVKIRFGSKDSIQINPQTKKKVYFDFSSDVNLGLMAGGKINISDELSIILPLAGFNVGSISVDSASTSGYAKTKTNLACITPYTGIILAFNGVQLGVFTGIDFIAGVAGYNWDYRNKPWLGIGLGYSIFTATANKTKQP